MSIVESVEAAVERYGRRIVGPLHRRRHRFKLRHGRLDKATLRAAREQWWGHEGQWYAGGTPPRQHNRVTTLVDGEHFFAALRAALEDAHDYVYVVGWCLTPAIPLGRNTEDEIVATRLMALLGATAEKVPVRLLLWAGALGIFQPTTRRMEVVRKTIQENCPADLVCHLDRTAHFSHCHHQKAIVVDGQIAFVGGMDLTTFQGDRWDTQQHPLRGGVNWHDVQLRLEGEVVADVEHNFRQRWAGSGGPGSLPHREPRVETDWHTPVQIVRTIPRGDYGFAPRGEFGIYHAYIQMLRQARRLIYLENQYLWSPDVMDVLLALLDQPPDEQFRMVIVLPAHAYDGKWDNDQHVDKLRSADRGRGIVSVYSPYASGPNSGVAAFTYRPIYVHAKVGIVDDEWLTVGSANFNSRGLITDSEINAVIYDAELAHNLRIDCGRSI